MMTGGYLEQLGGAEAGSLPLVRLWDEFLLLEAGAEALALLEEHPEMWSKSGIAALDALRQRALELGQEQLVNVCSNLAELARDCLQHGPTLALQAHGVTKDVIPPNELEDTLNQVGPLVDAWHSGRDTTALRSALERLHHVISRGVPWTIAADAGALNMELFLETSDESALAAAILIFDQLTVVAGTSEDRADALVSLGNALRLRHDLHGDQDDLDRAITALAAACDQLLPQANSEQRARALFAYGTTLLVRHRERGALADIDAAVEHLRDASEEISRQLGSRNANVLINLGNALRRRSGVTGSLEDLAEAIEAHTDAVAAAGPDSLGASLVSLGNAYRQRFDVGHDPKDLASARRTYEEALAHQFTPPSGRATTLNALALADVEAYTLSHDVADLEAAVARHREAVAHSIPRSRDEATHLATLIGALGSLEAAGRPGAVDEALELVTAAAEGTDLSGRMAVALSLALRQRYLATGDVASLRLADQMCATAVDASADDDRAELLSHRSWFLRELGEREDDEALLDAAVRVGAEAVAAARSQASTTPASATAVANYAAALVAASNARDEARLRDTAIEVLEQAIPETEHPDVAADLLGDLGAALLRRSATDEARADDLERGINRLREALQTSSAAHPERSRYATNLVVALFDAGSAHPPADADEAVALARRICAGEFEGRPSHVATVARNWGSWALEKGDWPQAAEAFEYGLEASSELVHSQALIRDRRAWQSGLSYLSAGLACARARCGNAAAAAAALERSRALVIVQALEQRALGRHAEMSDERPGLAGEFQAAVEQVRALDRLRGASSPSVSSVSGAASVAVEQVTLARRRLDARRKLARLASEIVGEGAGEPLAPAGVEQLALSGKTIAYVAPGPTAGVVVLLGDTGVAGSAAIEQLSFDAVERRMLNLFDAYVDGGHAWEAALDSVASWLWDVLVVPILAMQPHVEHLVVIPGTYFSFLPVHAAWREDGDGRRRYLLDDVVVSYAPSVRVLQLAAAESDATANSILAVAVGDPVGLGQLRFADVEVTTASSWFPTAEALVGPAATRRRVLDAIPKHDVTHFACHAFKNPWNHYESALVLNDEQLELNDLLTASSGRLRLAVLSACEASFADLAALDEMLSLQGALLAGGAKAVIASPWAVRDFSASLVMLKFYELWRGLGMAPAEALRAAQIWVRDTTNGEKSDAYPDLVAPIEERVPREARTFWRAARAHSNPVEWAGFSYSGA